MHLTNFIKDKRLTEGEDSFFESFLDTVKDFGFDYFCYHIIRPDIENHFDYYHVRGNFPKEWEDYYIKNNFAKIDPIQKLAQVQSEPFFWRTIPENFKISEEGMAYLDKLFNAGFSDGINIPIARRDLTNANFGFCRAEGDLDLSEDDITILKYICQHAHEIYLKHYFHNFKVDLPTLSPREQEVLYWAARGKSNNIIADIIGISPHTVDTIFRRCFTKLRMNDRVSVIIKALYLGLIDCQKIKRL